MNIVTAAVIGGALFSLLPPDILKGDPAKLLMPFLGLFMAGILPAISLTINSIKSGGFSVKRVTDLADELDKLLDYLQGMFVIALIAAICLVSAETTSWGLEFWFSFYTARVFNFLLGACLTLLLLSLPRIRRVFKTLLRISREIAVDEASAKIKDKMAKLPSIVDRFPTKEKFGELFEAKPIDKPD